MTDLTAVVAAILYVRDTVRGVPPGEPAVYALRAKAWIRDCREAVGVETPEDARCPYCSRPLTGTHCSGARWCSNCGWTAKPAVEKSGGITTEHMTCPRRMSELGPWEHEEDLDRWRCDRWSVWPGPGQVPRTCSFCGGINAADALALVRNGWDVEPTAKPYKRYLHPPGFRAALTEMQKAIREERDDPARYPSEVVPPVKVYIQHFTLAQWDELYNPAVGDQEGAGS